MKRNYIKRKMLILLTMATGVTALFSGCGKDKVDYVTDEAMEVTEDNNTTDASSWMPKDNVWEEAINEELGVKIEAKVTIPETTSVNVYEAQKKIYDTPEAKKEFLTNLSSQVYKFEIPYRSKQEIQSEIDTVELWIENYNTFLEPDDKEYIRVTNLLEEYKGYYEAAQDVLTPADDYSGNIYMLEYNGSEYIIEFTSNNQDNATETDAFYYDSYSFINIYLRDKTKQYENYEEMMENYVEITDMPADDFYEYDNICDITEEEAQKVALDFIEQLDIGDYTCINSEDKKYAGVKGGDFPSYDYWCDGYTFYFSRRLDDITFDYDVYFNSMLLSVQAFDYFSEKYGDRFFGYSENYSFEELEITVNDTGVVAMQYINPIEITDVLGEDVELLPFETVQDIIVEELLNNPQYECPMTFSNMELYYYTDINQEDDNKFGVVPIWRLSDVDRQGDDEAEYFIAVNAIDGTIVNIVERLCLPFLE